MSQLASRKYFFYALFIIAGCLLTFRLLHLQVTDKTYRGLEYQNAVQPVTLYPARGLIYDRNGELLVYNEAAYDLMLVPRRMAAMDTTLFCKLLNISRDEFNKRLASIKGYSYYKASVFEKQLTPQSVALLQEYLFLFPGFFTEVKTDRKYRYSFAAHVLGSIGEVSPAEIEKSEGYYKPGEYIGKSGIEKTYEEFIRGRKGAGYVLVDVHNRIQGRYEDGIFDTAALPGVNITTSLDIELQGYGELLLQNKIGSIVAIEPATGEILALVSSPGYDPNLLIGRQRTQNYNALLQDPRKPMFNRPLSAPYPPGSTFKILQALVGQGEGAITEHTRFRCGNGYRVGSHVVKCHPHPDMQDLKGALTYSCNPYFCQVFKATVELNGLKNAEEGYRNWYKATQTFGIGRKLGIDLFGESPGILYTADTYNKIYRKGAWKASTIISLGIGQGELGVTPLQMANMIAAVANRGWYITPHILKSSGNINAFPKAGKRIYTSVDSVDFAVVVDALENVVTSGTGRIARIDSVVVCGKTGTVQNPHGKDHSVFLAFAPKDNPKIAIAVVVENSGFGATWAAPIASLMIEKYLLRRESSKRIELEKRILEANLLN